MSYSDVTMIGQVPYDHNSLADKVLAEVKKNIENEVKESGKPYTQKDINDAFVKASIELSDKCRTLVAIEAVSHDTAINECGNEEYIDAEFMGGDRKTFDSKGSPVTIRIKKLDPRAKMPFKKPGQEENFCFDLYAIDRTEIKSGVFEYRTGLAFEIEDHPLKDNFILDIDGRPRSSVSETGLVLCNSVGTIDDPYRGEVKARFYQVMKGPDFKPYEPGDRIIQVKIGLTPRCQFIELSDNEELSNTTRGDGGFGSSGRQ